MTGLFSGYFFAFRSFGIDSRSFAFLFFAIGGEVFQFFSVNEFGIVFLLFTYLFSLPFRKTRIGRRIDPVQELFGPVRRIVGIREVEFLFRVCILLQLKICKS